MRSIATFTGASVCIARTDREKQQQRQPGRKG